MAKHAERDLYDYYATRLPKMLVRRNGELVVVNEELSWEARARLAEEKLQALVDGLASEEAWDHMMHYNPLAVAIATTAVQYHLRRTHEQLPRNPRPQVRRSAPTGAIEIVLAYAVVAFFITLLDLVLAWPVMIALGVWHSYIHQVPALGWLATLVSLIAIGIIIMPSQWKAKD